MFFLGLIGVFGIMMYAAVTGGNPGAFIDLPSIIVVLSLIHISEPTRPY